MDGMRCAFTPTVHRPVDYVQAEEQLAPLLPPAEHENRRDPHDLAQSGHHLGRRPGVDQGLVLADIRLREREKTKHVFLEYEEAFDIHALDVYNQNSEPM